MINIWRKTHKHLQWGALLILLLLVFVVQTTAQSDGELDSWESPDNLSRSGAAEEPVFVVDQSGVFHVFWQDEFAGYMHRMGDGDSWQEAEVIRVPFTSAPYAVPGMETFDGFWKPQMVIDPEGLLHTFWIGDEGVLFYSRALIENVAGGSGSWTAPARLAQPVANLDVTVDDIGKIHLSFIQTAAAAELSAGVYYRQTADGGSVWSDSTL